MARTLRFLGLALAAAGAWLLLAGEAGWVAAELGGRPAVRLLQGGAATFVAGLVLGVLASLGRRLGRGRCARCGAPTERGQSYCLDHLKATVDEARDHYHANPRRGRA